MKLERPSARARTAGVGRRSGQRRFRGLLQLESRRAGFTVVELIVVIAIIALLASLLLPALARVKDAAKSTSCLSRLKQWNLTLTMYAEDNEEMIPRESFFPGGVTINLWSNVRNPLAHDVWYNALPLEISERGAASFAPSPARVDFYDRAKLMHCPSALFPKDAEKDSVAFFSYAMNSKLILRPSTTVKLSTILRPSHTVTFLDNRLPDEPKVHPDQPTLEAGQPSAFASRFVTRHRHRGSLAFADGHVESVPGRDVTANGLAIIPQTRIVWTADPSLDPNIIE